MNTLIPYADPRYWNYPHTVNIPENEVLVLDGQVGLHPSMGPLKGLYDQGKMAIIHGVGYSDSIRSHFRPMDIWHTCEPDKNGEEGWLGQAVPDLDHNKENIVTTVSFGYSLFRALVSPEAPLLVWSTSIPTVS
jgi:uncharacterized protein (DUF1501 family)